MVEARATVTIQKQVLRGGKSSDTGMCLEWL